MKKFKRLLSCIVAVAMIAGMLVSLPSVFADSPITLTVDPSQNETETSFKTIRAAVAKAKEINPQSAEAMVTINVKPGDYEEQVRFDGMKFVTLQQDPSTKGSGKVTLHWYFCTGYCTSNTDLTGLYDPTIDWSKEETWNGYAPGDTKFTKYEIGQSLEGVSSISYYDVNHVKHENVPVNSQLKNLGGLGWSYDKMAALIVTQSSTDITIKDLNVLNSIPTMVTQGQIDGHVTPEAGSTLPPRSGANFGLTICNDDTVPKKPDEAIFTSDNKVDLAKVKSYIASGGTFDAEESAWLVKSSAYNERGHAIATLGDRITFENVTAKGNQDSIWASDGRAYFKDCTLIGGTDYIYGSASAVFDNCKLGFAGFSDYASGNPLTTPNTDKSRKYGYLFWNCTVYNENKLGGTSNFGGPWGASGQATFVNTTIDDNGTIGNSKVTIDPKGWGRFGAENGLSRLYEYGTKNKSGNPVDLSKRIKNKSVAEGGYGMGTVLDEWQALEFNPRNYFAASCDTTGKTFKDDWDPMNFGEKLTNVDEAIEDASGKLKVPSNESTEFTLPEAPEGVEYKWESNSPNITVSTDGKKITVTRPAAGEDPIESSIILYAKDSSTKAGDKVELPVTITPTTNTTDVFNIPVKITSSLTPGEDSDFAITISKNGATIKTQVVTMSAGTNEVSDTIENVPASEEGIEYDVKIVSKSDDLTVVSPENGEMKITGKTGQDVQLNISAQMWIDETVELDSINYSYTQGNKVFDLIALAKEAGADAEDLESSDIVKVEYTLNVTNPATKGTSFIDLVHGTPTSSATNDKLDNRFVLAKLGHWTQLDTVDNTQGFATSSNSEHQVLNVSGKFDGTTPNKVAVTINYKDSTVSLDATGSGNGKTKTPVTYGSFPANAVKGDLKMAIYRGDEEFNIQDVKVTYKKLVQGELPETPDGVGTYTFTDVVGGNLITDSESYKFVDGVDEKVAALFASADDETVMDSKFTANYKNYVGGTGNSATHPTIVLNADKGKYRIYYVGYNHGDNIQAKVNGKTYTAGEGKQLAARSTDANYVLKYYEIDIEMTSKNSTITFDSTEAYLPDTYCVAVVGSAELGGTEPTPTPTASTTPTASPSASTTPTVSPSASTTPTASPSASTTPTVSPSASTTPTASPSATTNPTPTPTDSAAPADSYKIESAKFDESGKLTVKYTATGAAKLIAVTYKDNSCRAITNVKMFDISTSDEQTLDYDKPASGVTKVFIWQGTDNIMPLSNAASIDGGTAPTPTPTVTPTPTPSATITPSGDTISIDFTKMTAVPVYSKETGNGFVSTSGAIMPEGYDRQVAATSTIKIDANGASVTESDGAYISNGKYKESSNYTNYGGLIYRQDVAPGAYHIEITLGGSSTSANTKIAPTGMDASRLTDTKPWDTAGQVARTASAKWNDNTWSYDFATGESFIELDIEPTTLPTSSAAQTVTVKSVSITPIAKQAAGDKPTIHILGDSTQKSYTFNETISSWGQTLYKYFDLSKVNVVNYSMGGRCMRNNYTEGRFDDVLINGKEGDYVFLHSAHNDESPAETRFDRGCQYVDKSTTKANALYNKWLDMYVNAIKARGMVPVLVSPMPRGAGKATTFNPDSPANMKAKAKADPDVAYVELYQGAVDYYKKLDANEGTWTYNNIEAGETPANNSANGAKGDGTHYREAAAKQFCRIMLQSIYDQSVASTDTYKDKAIMEDLVSYMPDSVKTAAKSKTDWSAVFPELAVDVDAVDVVPGATKQAKDNYYYRNSIEKALQIGALHKDAENKFKPTETITVGEFARGIEKIFGLEANSLNDYSKTYDELKGTSSSSVEISSVDETVGVADATGNLTVTVEQPAKGGKVMAYNESQRVIAYGNIPAKSEMAPDKVLVDNEYFTLTAPHNLTQKAEPGNDSSVKYENGNIDGNYVYYRNKNDAEVIFEAKQNGTLDVYATYHADRPVELVNVADKNDTQSSVGVAGKSVTFNVEAGKKYKLYQNGSDQKLYGVVYRGEYPQSDTSLKANSGDTIRVTASAEDGYTLNSILVGGSAKATTREYTFTITADTTVSATFDKEPELVEHTVIASDAALTREVMGAILYDAYNKAMESNPSWKEYADQYIYKNSGVPAPGDPDYDPNIDYTEGSYFPLTVWTSLTDLEELNTDLYAKVKGAYTLGLIRTEDGIARGEMKNGTKLQPQTKVTRAKAAKALVFCFILTQNPKENSQVVPGEHNYAAETVAPIATPNPEAPTVPIKMD